VASQLGAMAARLPQRSGREKIRDQFEDKKSNGRNARHASGERSHLDVEMHEEVVRRGTIDACSPPAWHPLAVRNVCLAHTHRCRRSWIRAAADTVDSHSASAMRRFGQAGIAAKKQWQSRFFVERSIEWSLAQFPSEQVSHEAPPQSYRPPAIALLRCSCSASAADFARTSADSLGILLKVTSTKSRRGISTWNGSRHWMKRRRNIRQLGQTCGALAHKDRCRRRTKPQTFSRSRERSPNWVQGTLDESAWPVPASQGRGAQAALSNSEYLSRCAT